MKTMKAPVISKLAITARGNVLQRLAGLAAESGGALEPDEGEDGDDDGQAEVVDRHAVHLELCRVERKTVLEENHARQRNDAGDRKRFEERVSRPTRF